VHHADPNYRWKVLGIVMVGTLMSALDSSIVNVSLPKIMADFGASVDDIEWVITGYMLSFATFMPLTGWLRDRFGPKLLYTTALIVFTAASLMCGLAWNLSSLVAARVLQAVGGGALTPIGLAMISDVFSPKERPRALGYWGMGAVVGPTFGPTLGGYLTNQVSWRSIFMINLPIGIIGAIWAITTLRKDKISHAHRKPFDLAGFLFLSMFLVGFLLGLSKGEREGWTSAYILACWGVAISGLVGFLTVEFLIRHPVLDLQLFSYPIFTASAIVTFARSVALYGGTFLLPLFLQQLMGLDEIESGLILLPGALIIAVVMTQSSRMNEKLGPRLCCWVGLALVGISMFLYYDINVNTSIGMGIIAPTLLRGAGIGFLIAPITAAAMNAVPTEKTAAASAMLNLIQQVAGSVGIALLGMVLSNRTQFHLAVLGNAIQRDAPVTVEVTKSLYYLARMLGYSGTESGQVAHGLIVAHVQASASVAGFEDSFIVGGVIVIVGLVAAALMPKDAVLTEGEPIALE